MAELRPGDRLDLRREPDSQYGPRAVQIRPASSRCFGTAPQWPFWLARLGAVLALLYLMALGVSERQPVLDGIVFFDPDYRS